jgi:hypothetical protein
MFYDPINRQILRAGTASNLFEKWNGSAWTNITATAFKASATLASRNSEFVLTDLGLRRITVANTNTQIGWIPEGLDININALAGSSGWMPNDSQVAYRVLFGLKGDANEFFLGAPSGRTLATNSTGGTRDVTIRVTVPPNVGTAHFYQIYRTLPSAGDDIDPGDEMYLIYEDFVTTTDITNGYIEFTDRVPNGNGGAALYTNESQQTDAQANFPCEAATSSIGAGELETFAGCVWASSYKPRSSIELTLLAVLTDTGLNARSFTGDYAIGSPVISNVSSFTGIAVGQYVVASGILPFPAYIISINTGAGTITVDQNAASNATGAASTAGDVITIAGVEYYASTTESIPSRYFLVSTDASAAKAVRLTAESLVRVVNRSTSTVNVSMKYVSGVNQLPGRMLIFARSDRASTYTVQADSHGMAFYPNITTAQTILSKEDQSLVVFSKPDEPMAFPPLNFFKMPGNAKVLGLAALRAALLVWTDKGLYRITGVYGNFSSEIVDASVTLASTTTNPGLGVVVIDNIAYGLTDKGLVAATEAGAVIVSDPVANYLQNSTITTARLSAHQGDGLVFVPTTFCTLVFHSKTGIWTAFPSVYKCGVYDFSTLRMALQDGATSRRARDATYQAANLYDSDAAVTIDSISSNDVTLSSAPSGWAVGDLLIQGGNTQVIAAIVGAVATVEDGSVYSPGGATVRIGYTCSVTYCPVGDNSNTLNKHLRYVNLLFDGAPISSSALGTFDNTDYDKYITCSLSTDLDPNVRTVTDLIESPDYPFMARFFVPTESQRCAVFVPAFSWRNTANAARIIGIDFDYDPVGDKTRR